MFVIQHLKHFLPPFPVSFFSFIFILCVQYFVCPYVCPPLICLVPTETRRGQMPLDLELWTAVHVSAGHWTWILWDSNQCSQPLSHLSSHPSWFFHCLPLLSILPPLRCVQTPDGCRVEIDHRRQICGSLIPTCPWLGAFSCVFLG